jgi:regulator of RNase E activity RraB
MTLQEQFEQVKVQLEQLVAGRPKFYRAWEDTWATFHEDPAAFHKAYDSLYGYDDEKNKVWDEVKRLREIIEENT